MPTVSFNTHLPGYEVLAELGRGNTRVLKARHVATGDLVAIKQFAFNTDAETLRRFQQESEIMTRIAHPNVVKVREIHLDAAMPYLVMEFVEGGDLRSLLRSEGHLDVPTTIRLGLQMAEAFRAIHPENVIHRDIKPENILYRRLVSGELHFLLTDFGIAKIRADESSRTQTGQSLMTYEYASPEQFDNPRHVDAATDYYSLGAVLYECLSGQVPFPLRDETGLAQFMSQVLTLPPPTLTLASGQFLPPSLRQLVQGLLTKLVDERIRDVDELELLLEQAKVEQLRANRTMLAGAVATPTPPRPVSVTRPAPVAAPAVTDDEEVVYESRASSQTWWLVLLAVLVAGGALAFIWHTRSTRQPMPTSTVSVDSSATTTADSIDDDASTNDNLDEEDDEDTDSVIVDDGPKQFLPNHDSSANEVVTPPVPVADSAATVPADSSSYD